MRKQEIPNEMDKQEAVNGFKNYFNRVKESYKLSGSTTYQYGYSHDGITLWNDKSSAIGHDEIMLIKAFCDDYGYTLSCFTRKIYNPSGYGGVGIEINLCI